MYIFPYIFFAFVLVLLAMLIAITGRMLLAVVRRQKPVIVQPSAWVLAFFAAVEVGFVFVWIAFLR